jgi:acyl carrier protein
MCEFVEPRLRRLVAEHLGVGRGELLSTVSLRDDLAADSLDLLELTMALEEHFEIAVPELALHDVRTYGELVQATGLLVQARIDAERAEHVPR